MSTTEQPRREANHPELPAPAGMPLFVSGQDGYHTYRIPALAVTPKGTLLAFCEGRKTGRSDSGAIDMLLKRSSDGGKTWSSQTVICSDPGHTCGNPCVVVDTTANRICLLATWNRGDDTEKAIVAQTSHDTRRVLLMHSTDDGATWSTPQDLTATCKHPDWTWYATGPGNGIQIQQGPCRGRLVIPCDHVEAHTLLKRSHVILSDDHGLTWTRGAPAPLPDVNECSVVELQDSTLLLNMRNYNRAKPTRQTALSTDGGMTWHKQQHDPTLIEPVCQAALIRLQPHTPNHPPLLCFSNPAHTSERVSLTLRFSADNGQTWPRSQTLHQGPSAYSALATLPDGNLACLYEAGRKHCYESLLFVTLSPPDFK